MKTVVLSRAATKDLDALPADAGHQLLEALYLYGVSGRGDIKQLSGSNALRLRIGRYRAIFDEDKTTILAIYIGKRETTTYRRI